MHGAFGNIEAADTHLLKSRILGIPKNLCPIKILLVVIENESLGNGTLCRTLKLAFVLIAAFGLLRLGSNMPNQGARRLGLLL